MSKSKKIGGLLLIVGLICLILSILCAFISGGPWVAILFWGSIIINTAAVLFIRKKEG